MYAQTQTRGWTASPETGPHTLNSGADKLCRIATLNNKGSAK